MRGENLLATQTPHDAAEAQGPQPARGGRRCSWRSADWRSRRPPRLAPTPRRRWSWSVPTPSRTCGTRSPRSPSAPGVGLVAYNATNPATGAINEKHHADRRLGRAEQHRSQPHRPTRWPPATCSFARPNGSGQGVAALRLALNAPARMPAGHWPRSGSRLRRHRPLVEHRGCHRQLHGRGLQFVPFDERRRRATGPVHCSGTNCPASPPTSATAPPPTPRRWRAPSAPRGPVHPGEPDHAVQLRHGHHRYHRYWPAGSPTAQPTGAQTIDLYVPQPGSGTRSFWESASG